MQLDFNKMFAPSKYQASIWTMEVTTASVSFQTAGFCIISSHSTVIVAKKEHYNFYGKNGLMFKRVKKAFIK